MSVLISDDILQAAQISEIELKREIAIRLSIGGLADTWFSPLSLQNPSFPYRAAVLEALNRDRVIN